MEVINSNSNQTDRSQSPAKPWAHHLYLGLALIAVGGVWLLYNFDVIGYKFFDIFFSWEMLLLVIGGYLLTMKKWAVGGIVALVGAFFMLANVLDIYIPFDKVVLPLLCIVAGLAIILTRRNR